MRGVPYESYPTHLILKPLIQETVVLAAKPLASGEVHVDGVQIWSFYLAWKHILPPTATLPPIQVLPAMAVLNLSQRHIDSGGVFCLQSGQRFVHLGVGGAFERVGVIFPWQFLISRCCDLLLSAFVVLPLSLSLSLSLSWDRVEPLSRYDSRTAPITTPSIG
jgi:hypothetical protein